MRFRNKAAALLLSAVVVIGCGKVKEAREVVNGVRQSAKIAKQMADNGDDFQTKFAKLEKKAEERAANGVTKAMDFRELKKFLPSELDGYEADDAKGQSISTGHMSYSVTSRKFRAENGQYVRVEILDYAVAPRLFAGASMLSAGFTFESDDESIKQIKLGDDVAGMETFRRKNGRASLTLTVGTRFIVNIEANKQSDTEFVKSAAKAMKLSEMTKM